MERHPLTPMTDPDLRRWLARQTDDGRRPPPPRGPARRPRRRGAGRGRRAAASGSIVADAIANDDLLALGALAAGHALVTGGSGIALGLPANFGLAAGGAEALPATEGDTLVLAGSCSNATRGQIAAYTPDHPALKLAIGPGLDPGPEAERALAFVLANRGKAPLVYSSADPAETAAQPGRARHRGERPLLRDHPHQRREPRRRRGLPPDHRRRRRDLRRRRHRPRHRAAGHRPGDRHRRPRHAHPRHAAARRRAQVGQLRRPRLLHPRRGRPRRRAAMTRRRSARAPVPLGRARSSSAA